MLTSESGAFATPNYPNPYPNDTVCLWVIKVPKAKQIRVVFDAFNLAADAKDFLAYSEDGIYPSDKRPLLITAPGQREYTFVGDTAFFEFVSDAKNSAQGFQGRYESSFQGRGVFEGGVPGATVGWLCVK